MTKESHLQYLRDRLRHVDAQLHEAERKLMQGSPTDKVHAAGELAVLRGRHDEVEQKIAQMEAQHEDLWGDLKGEVAVDLDAIGSAIQRLFTGV